MACSAPTAPRGVANAAAPVEASGDRDADTIPDGGDRCPAVPEDWDAVADADGCPDPDDDGDGIADADDACPDEASPLHRGCPPQRCAVLLVEGIADCFLSELYDVARPADDTALRAAVAQVAAFPEIHEVTLRIVRAPAVTEAAARAQLEGVRTRMLALGWPARVAIRLARGSTSSDPAETGMVLGEVSAQRHEREPRFRPGTCTMFGDVYRPLRPDTACRATRPGVTTP